MASSKNAQKILQACYEEMNALGAPMIHHEAIPPCHHSGWTGYREEWIVTTERECSRRWVDYSNERASKWGGETINPELQAVADKYGVTLEWGSAGYVSLFFYG